MAGTRAGQFGQIGQAGQAGHVGSWSQLRSGLVWPSLLRTAGLALRPARLGFGVLMIVAVALLDRLGRTWSGRDDGPITTLAANAGGSLASVVRGVFRLEPGAGARAGFGQIRSLLDDLWLAPLSSITIIALSMLVVGVLGLATARSAATESARLKKQSWTEAMGFAVSRWASAWLTLLGPVLVSALLLLFLAAAGWAGLSLPWVQAVGGVLFGLAMLIATAVVLLLALTLLGAPMLLPSLACEATDGIDAVQRTMAYVAARPLQYGAYVLILCVQAAITTALLIMLAVLVSETARATATAWTPPSVDPGQVVEGSNASLRAMNAGVLFWLNLPLLMVGGYVASFVHTGGTVLYLAMRRVCDGQDVDDVWMPGSVPGLRDPQMDRRGGAAGRGEGGDDDE